MSKILWKNKKINIKKSNLYSFEKFISKKYDLSLDNNFIKIWKWTIKNSKLFWSLKYYAKIN